MAPSGDSLWNLWEVEALQAGAGLYGMAGGFSLVETSWMIATDMRAIEHDAT